jgi:hypothetical protein
VATALERIVARLIEAESPVLAIVQKKVYPNTPTHNASLPYLIVSRQSGGGDNVILTGRRGTRQDLFGLEAYARSQEQAAALLAAAIDQLNGWRDRAKGVQGCFALDDADEAIDGDINISTQSVSMWANLA